MKKLDYKPTGYPRVANGIFITDTLGCLLAVKVYAANIHDTKSGIEPAKKAVKKHSKIKGFCAGVGYRKTFVCSYLRFLSCL